RARGLRARRPGPGPGRGRLPRMAGAAPHAPRARARELAHALRGAERQEGGHQGLPRGPSLVINRATSAAPATVSGDPVLLRSPSPIELPREICTLYPRASRLEWLLTNGTGGFAMGTVAGSNTRRYHGLLVASLHPPVQRVVTLARLEETVLTREGAVPLSVNQYPNTLHPDGHTRLARFALADGPVWTWSVGGVEVERRILLVPGEQTVVVRYATSAPLRLRVEPLLAFRDYHALTHRNPEAWTGFEEEEHAGSRLVRFQPYAGLPSLRLAHRGSAFEAAPEWHENVEYLEELDRGLDFREDLFL